MAATLINLLLKTSYDFSFLAVLNSTQYVIAEAIDISQDIDAILVVRVHAVNISNGSYTFALVGDGWTPTTNGFDFLSNAKFQFLSLQATSSTAAGALLVSGARVFGPNASLVMTALQGAVVNPLSITVSVDLCLRNPEDSGANIGANGSFAGFFSTSTPGGVSPSVLQPLFSKWGLDVNSVNFMVKTLPAGMAAQTLSDSLVAFSPSLVANATPELMVRYMAHELTHVAQIRQLGWDKAAARADGEEQMFGLGGTRAVPETLRDMAFADLNPVDSRFTLEQISGRIGEIAGGLFTNLSSSGGCSCGSRGGCNCNAA